MSGLLGAEPVDLVATWVAALVTLVVLGGMLGERRLFGWSQHLLAGLATGFLALIAISEVVVPRLVAPIADGGADRPELWLGLALVGLLSSGVREPLGDVGSVAVPVPSSPHAASRDRPVTAATPVTARRRGPSCSSSGARARPRGRRRTGST